MTHIPAEEELNGKGCRPGSGAAGTSACKRNRGGSGTRDSCLQKPVPDGELELCLTCVSPSYRVQMSF